MRFSTSRVRRGLWSRATMRTRSPSARPARGGWRCGASRRNPSIRRRSSRSGLGERVRRRAPRRDGGRARAGCATSVDRGTGVSVGREVRGARRRGGPPVRTLCHAGGRARTRRRAGHRRRASARAGRRTGVPYAGPRAGAASAGAAAHDSRRPDRRRGPVDVHWFSRGSVSGRSAGRTEQLSRQGQRATRKWRPLRRRGARGRLRGRQRRRRQDGAGTKARGAAPPDAAPAGLFRDGAIWRLARHQAREDKPFHGI